MKQTTETISSNRRPELPGDAFGLTLGVRCPQGHLAMKKGNGRERGYGREKGPCEISRLQPGTAKIHNHLNRWNAQESL